MMQNRTSLFHITCVLCAGNSCNIYCGFIWWGTSVYTPALWY